MEWINELKEKFSKRRIRSLDRTKEFSRDFVDLESAQRVGVIINADVLNPDDQALVKQYFKTLKQSRKSLLIIELSFHKKGEAAWQAFGDHHIFINPAKLNWLDYPTPNIESQIRQQELDILIDLDLSARMTAKYVCSMAKARTRTGIHREGLESCYELMIHRNEDTDLKALLRELDYFLNMIDNGQRARVKVSS